MKVENQKFQDVVVYVLRSGQRQRLGRVSAASDEVLTLPRGLVRVPTDLQFFVDAIGSGSFTRTITVYPGDQVTLTVIQ